jgi:hypothetical protein
MRKLDAWVALEPRGAGANRAPRGVEAAIATQTFCHDPSGVGFGVRVQPKWVWVGAFSYSQPKWVGFGSKCRSNRVGGWFHVRTQGV